MIILCAVLLVISVLSFDEVKRESNCEQANDNARFNCNKDLFNNEANKEIRAKRLAEKEAAEEKKKAEEAQDKGEGQFKVKF